MCWLSHDAVSLTSCCCSMLQGHGLLPARPSTLLVVWYQEAPALARELWQTPTGDTWQLPCACLCRH